MKTDYWWPVHCTFIIICIMLALSLSGCGSGGVMDVAKLPISDEAITSITGSITDTSVQKETLYTDMVKNRNPVNLVPVIAGLNSSKRDRNPKSFLPKINKEDYINRWADDN